MAYGLKFKSEFTSELGVNYKVKILQKDYASAVTELVMGGEPVIINYNGDEAKFTAIRGSECAINFFAQYNYQFVEIVKADKNDFQIQILKNDVLYWQGFVIQDNYNEPFMPVPYLVTLRATDGLGDLKFYEYKDLNQNLFLTKQTQIEAILACLSKLKNATQLVSSIDIYESRIDRNDATNESLNRVFINPFVYLSSGDKSLDCAAVLKTILELYNAYIYYKEGKYFIERINYKLSNTIARRTYNIDFTAPSSTVATSSTANILGSIGGSSNLRFVNSDATLTYQTPFKYLDIENKNNIPSALTLNSQFLQWDSANTLPKYWNSNGLSISRTGSTRSDAVLFIGSKNNSDSSILATSPNITLPVYNFSNMLFTGDKFKVKLAYFGNVRVCIKVSSPTLNYYLTKSGDNYIWSTTFKFLNFQVPDDVYVLDRLNRSGDWRADFWYTSEIATPAIADTTFNKLELFIYPSYDNPNGYQFGGLLREFSVSLSVNNTNNYEGEIYKVSTDKNYTETYDDLVPTFGEFGNIGNTNQLIYNTSTGYTYTQSWYREGKTESKSLLEIASRSVLNQYRTPYIQFTSSVRGDFDFGKVYNINNLTGRFMPYKATLNLKSDVTSIEMLELLSESDAIESTYTFSKKANLGTADYNSVTPKSAVDTNRPRPQRVYT